MVGSALVRALARRGIRASLTRTHAELDLTDAGGGARFFAPSSPTTSSSPRPRSAASTPTTPIRAEFIHENLMIEANVIHAARTGRRAAAAVPRLELHLPARWRRSRSREDALLTGPLEPTNEPYAIAKIAGIKLCEAYNRQYGADFRSVMPTNLYGPGDNYDLENSHVLPALMAARRTRPRLRGDAEVRGLGHGHADARVPVRRRPGRRLRPPDGRGATTARWSTSAPGEDVTIRELAETVMEVGRLRGRIVFDASKPDGTIRRLMNSNRLAAMGWRPRVEFREGLAKMHTWFLLERASPASAA